MKLQWKSSPMDCLAPVLQTIQQRELTQELKLPEAMADVGHVLGAWGQGILRGKQWNGESVSCAGGVMVWVLYAPEDGSAPQVLEGWVPFQLSWDLPEDTPEGTLRLECLVTLVDARSVSPRKLMLRVGVAVSAEAYAPMTAQCFQPEGDIPEVELLKTTYPMTLVREAGEKAFLLDEELELPEGAAQPEKLICYTLHPQITDERVMTNRAVFRGQGKLHILGLTAEKELESWDLEVPFSQFSQLTAEHSGEAQGDFRLCVTSCELELAAPGQLRLKCGLVAQYRITDRIDLELVEDAYCPGRELQLQWQTLSLPVLLETRTQTVDGEAKLPGEPGKVVDLAILPAAGDIGRTGEGVEALFAGTLQLLSGGPGGDLQTMAGHWEQREQIPCHADAQVFAALPGGAEGTVRSGPGGAAVKLRFPVNWTVSTLERLPQVAGLELGEEVAPKADAPSLILRRAGGERLWDIAKQTGSTVAAIRQASALEGEPAPNQMLLIPVK